MLKLFEKKKFTEVVATLRGQEMMREELEKAVADTLSVAQEYTASLNKSDPNYKDLRLALYSNEAQQSLHDEIRPIIALSRYLYPGHEQCRLCFPQTPNGNGGDGKIIIANQTIAVECTSVGKGQNTRINVEHLYKYHRAPVVGEVQYKGNKHNREVAKTPPDQALSVEDIAKIKDNLCDDLICALMDKNPKKNYVPGELTLLISVASGKGYDILSLEDLEDVCEKVRDKVAQIKEEIIFNGVFVVSVVFQGREYVAEILSMA